MESLSVAEEFDEDHLRSAKRMNNVFKVCYVLVVLVFNAVFWAIALNEYLIPAEFYI